MNSPLRFASLRLLAPGILVAATGVGAGDLLSASLAGAEVGTVIVWGALVGAVLKWTLNEGIARWQLATGTTLLDGWVTRFGPLLSWTFLVYLILWSYLVGGTLIGACAVAGTAILPLGDVNDLAWSPAPSKLFWGTAHSLVGLAMVWFGGFRLFSKLMSFCIALLFVGVLVTAVLLQPDWSALVSNLFVPRLPSVGGHWLIALVGGVGGTVTLLSYGYWIREDGRSGLPGLRISQIDLAVGYTMTAFFGIAMVVIGSRVQIDDESGSLITQLADQLAQALGEPGRWLFLIGFWGAVFSSLLGVWQGVPYLFADFLAMRRGASIDQRSQIDLTRTLGYRIYLLALAIIPLATLQYTIQSIQLAYAVFGALFMPGVAITLLVMNNRSDWVGRPFRNSWLLNILLVVTLLFFVYMGVDQLAEAVSFLRNTVERWWG